MVEAVPDPSSSPAGNVAAPKAPPKPPATPEEAEAKKNEGNEALKAGKIAEAIALYTEAIEMNKNEGMFTNRAMAYIKQKKYKEALFDCE